MTKQEVAAQLQSLYKAKATAGQIERQLGALKARPGGAEAVRAALAELGRLQTEKLREQLLAEQARRTSLEEELRGLRAAVERGAGEVAAAREELDSAQAQRDELAARASALGTQLDAARAEAATAQRKAETITNQVCVGECVGVGVRAWAWAWVRGCARARVCVHDLLSAAP